MPLIQANPSVQSKAEVTQVIITGVSDYKPSIGKDGTSYPRVQLVTKEHGHLFPFTANVKGLQYNVGAGIQATVVAMPTKYMKDGKEETGYNISSVVFQTIAPEVQAKINAAAAAGMTFTI